MIWHVQSENFIINSTRIFMKAFHLLLFHGPELEYIECIEMAIIEFLLFVLTATLGGMFLCAPECFSLCSYLLSGYTKRDVRSNEATTNYLLMGGASSSILIELQEIVNGLINTQMYNSPGILIALLSITVGIGFKLSPTPFHQWTPDVYEGVRSVFAFLSVTSKVATSALATRIFAIRSMILGNLIATTQTSMKRMLAYSSIGQIGYVIIGRIVGDSNDGYASMITYMLFYIFMNLGTFARIVSFGPRTGADNIWDYAGLKDPFLALSSLPPLAGGPIFLVSIGILTSIVSIDYYIKRIKLLMTGRNKEITPHVQNSRRSPLRSNNSIELSMIVCVIASIIAEISMNPITAIA
ncbi:hypothetical protein AMTRI_Chr05g73170 [Amborella trichopoda]